MPNTEAQIKAWTIHKTQHDAEEGTRTLVRRHEQEPQVRPQATPTQNGCSKAWLLLDPLHAEIGSVCEALEVSESNELLGYNGAAVLTICADVLWDEIWENVNPGLDRILGFGRPQEEIVALICCSQEGLQGLYKYLEVLVEQRGVVGGLLQGKVEVLMAAMAK